MKRLGGDFFEELRKDRFEYVQWSLKRRLRLVSSGNTIRGFDIPQLTGVNVTNKIRRRHSIFR